MSDPQQIGFPPSLIDEKPHRFEVLMDNVHFIAINKDKGLPVREHPWNNGLRDLDFGLNTQLKDGKPELLRLNADLFASVYNMDREISGITLFSKTRASLETLKNAFGSGVLRGTFLFLAPASQNGVNGFEIDAPLLPHRSRQKMIPSTAKGKKAMTRFRKITDSPLGDYSLWLAEAGYFRMHQIRAHAAVAGIPLLGDELYGGSKMPSKGDLAGGKRIREAANRPVFETFVLHLMSLNIPELNGVTVDVPSVVIKAALPKAVSVLIKRFGVMADELGSVN